MPSNADKDAADRVLDVWRRTIRIWDDLSKSKSRDSQRRLEQLTLALAQHDRTNRGYQLLNEFFRPRDLEIRQRIAIRATAAVVDLMHKGGLTIEDVKRVAPGTLDMIVAATAPGRFSEHAERRRHRKMVIETIAASDEALADGRGPVNAVFEILENLNLPGWSRSSLVRLGSKDGSKRARRDTGRGATQKAASARKRGTAHGTPKIADD